MGTTHKSLLPSLRKVLDSKHLFAMFVRHWESSFKAYWTPVKIDLIRGNYHQLLRDALLYLKR